MKKDWEIKIIKFVYGSLERWQDLCKMKTVAPKTYGWVCNILFIAGMVAGAWITLIFILLTN